MTSSCCVSRPGACGGLWTGQMLLVCSTYVSVMCLYCFVFDVQRNTSRQKHPIEMQQDVRNVKA